MHTTALRVLRKNIFLRIHLQTHDVEHMRSWISCVQTMCNLTNVTPIHINESIICALTKRRGWVCKHTLAVFYGATSVSATVFTKSVMSGYGFRFLPFMMTLERMFMASSLLLSEKRSLQGVLQSCQQLWPLTLVSVVNTFVAISSLEGLNLPMYNALKRLTSLVTLVMEAVVLNQYSSSLVQISVFFIAAGALIAAANDLEMDFLSYSWALGSCCMNALYLTLVKRACNSRRPATVEENKKIHATPPSLISPVTRSSSKARGGRGGGGGPPGNIIGAKVEGKGRGGGGGGGGGDGRIVSEISLVNNIVPIPLLLIFLEVSRERGFFFPLVFSLSNNIVSTSLLFMFLELSRERMCVCLCVCVCVCVCVCLAVRTLSLFHLNKKKERQRTSK
jgi:uncharacterized membrane protein YgcG